MQVYTSLFVDIFMSSPFRFRACKLWNKVLSSGSIRSDFALSWILCAAEILKRSAVFRYEIQLYVGTIRLYLAMNWYIHVIKEGSREKYSNLHPAPSQKEYYTQTTRHPAAAGRPAASAVCFLFFVFYPCLPAGCWHPGYGYSIDHPPAEGRRILGQL